MRGRCGSRRALGSEAQRAPARGAAEMLCPVAVAPLLAKDGGQTRAPIDLAVAVAVAMA